MARGKSKGKGSGHTQPTPSGTPQTVDKTEHPSMTLYKELNNDVFKDKFILINIPNNPLGIGPNNNLLYSVFYASNREGFRTKKNEERKKIITKAREELLKLYETKKDDTGDLSYLYDTNLDKNERSTDRNTIFNNNKNYIKSDNKKIGNKLVPLLQHYIKKRIIIIDLHERNSTFKDDYLNYISNETLLIVRDQTDNYKCLFDKNNNGKFDNNTVAEVIEFLKKNRDLYDSTSNHKEHNKTAPGAPTSGATAQGKTAQSQYGLPTLTQGQMFTRKGNTITYGYANSDALSYYRNIHGIDSNSYGYNRRSRNYVAPRAQKNSQVLLLFLVPIMLIFLLFALSRVQ